MSDQKLRHYQIDCADAVMNALDGGKRRVLYTLATGLGKTTIMAELVKRLRAKGYERILIIVHRKEIVIQIRDRVADHCGLSRYYDVGVEQNIEKALTSCKVVVGNVATVRSDKRLTWFQPDVIITDECHRACAKSYLHVYKRFGVPENCIHIGCTATAKRTDRQSLYARHIDGTPVIIEDKRGKKREATAETSVYEQHVYERTILEGIEDGYLVPVHGHTIETDTDISGVETDIDGDFKEGQLQQTVNNDPRTKKAISGWIDAGCTNRPTLIFCAGVKHAHSVAEAFCKAGFTAKALDGETEGEERGHTLNDFKAGRLQVLANCGLFTEGMDAPTCACIIHMRPTKSWNLYVQMTGRGLRVLPGVVDAIEEPEARCAEIAWSAKPDCIVLDMVDVCGKHDLCALPSILDLPAKLDLQGQSLTEAKRMIDDYGDAVEHLEDDSKEVPDTFQKLQVRLQQLELIRGAKNVNEGWKVSDDGFRFNKLPVGYTAQLLPSVSGKYRLRVEYRGQEIYNKEGKSDVSFRRYLQTAARAATRAAAENEETRPKGTFERLTEKQRKVLFVRRHTQEQIDAMSFTEAKALIGRYVAEYNRRREQVA